MPAILDALHLELIHAARPRSYDTQGKMMPGVKNRIGVPKVDVRRAAAGVVRRGDGRALLREVCAAPRALPQEVVMVAGLVVATEPGLEFTERVARADGLIRLIDNWATCDLLGSVFPDMKENEAAARAWIGRLLNADDDWSIRLGLVLLLCNFARRPAVRASLAAALAPRVLTAARRSYYVSMGLAWMLAECFVDGWEESEAASLRATVSGVMDAATARRTARKVRESLRFTKAQKDRLSQAMREALARAPRRADEAPARAVAVRSRSGAPLQAHGSGRFGGK